MLPAQDTERDIIGWPDVPTEGQGVWITERLKFHALPDVSIRERKTIYPVAARPDDWRANRSLILSRVAEVIPVAELVRYQGGVARFETPDSIIEAYTGGYNAHFRRSRELSAVESNV